MRDVIHKYPSQEADRFQVRMPDGLRDRLREAAAANGRSMNSEIVHRLLQSFDTGAGPKTAEDLHRMLGELMRKYEDSQNA